MQTRRPALSAESADLAVRIHGYDAADQRWHVTELALQRDRLRDRQIARRRARVRRLHADGKSGRQIADLLDVGLATVQRDLRALEQLQMLSEPERDERGRFVRGGPMAGAEPGNFRSLRHGAKSKRLVEPRARELVPGIFAANPHLDQARAVAGAGYEQISPTVAYRFVEVVELA